MSNKSCRWCGELVSSHTASKLYFCNARISNRIKSKFWWRRYMIPSNQIMKKCEFCDSFIIIFKHKSCKDFYDFLNMFEELDRITKMCDKNINPSNYREFKLPKIMLNRDILFLVRGIFFLRKTTQNKIKQKWIEEKSQ